MGWTFTHISGLKPKEVMDSLYTATREGRQITVLRSKMVGSEYYAAVHFYCEENGKVTEDVVVAIVALTRQESHSYDNFGYKDISEFQGPIWRRCPLPILELLSVTDDPVALEWRKECLDYWEHQNSPYSLKNLPEGAMIKFKAPWSCRFFNAGDEVTLSKVGRRTRTGRKTFIWTEGRYRISEKNIPKDYLVLPGYVF